MSYLNDSYDIDLYVNISNSPFTLGKPERRHRLFGHSLNRFKKPAVYVNCTGVQNNGKNIYTFDGSAAAYNNDGSLFYEGIPYTNELAVLPFDPDTRSFTGMKSISSQRSETASIYEALHYGIQKFTEQAGIRKVVIGVSGGIDSAVNAALYATVFKPEDMLLVNMPSTYNSQMTKVLLKNRLKISAVLMRSFLSRIVWNLRESNFYK